MTAITQITFSVTDGRTVVKAVHGQFSDAVEVKFDEDGPVTSLMIFEAESLVNLLRQVIAQAREFERQERTAPAATER